MTTATRITIDLVAAVLALLAFAIAVVWIVSFSSEFGTEFKYHGELCRAWIKGGVVGVDNRPAVETAAFLAQRDLWVANQRFGGKDLIMLSPPRIPARWSHSSSLLLPAAILLLALAPAVRLAGLRRSRRRRASGLCPACGYDWRATPGRCSECGGGAA